MRQLLSIISYLIITTFTVESINSQEKQNQRLNETFGMNLTFKTPRAEESNIFFLETSCFDTNFSNILEPELLLTAQAACAIESAARMHPDSNIYLFYTCPLDAGSLRRSSPLVQNLFQYPNIHVWKQSLSSLFNATPLEELFASGKLEASTYRAPHLSDVLRFLTLWKYGGIYLDLDFVVMKPLNDLGTNWACAENETIVANAAMCFKTDGVGKVIVDMCVEDLRNNFVGSVSPELDISADDVYIYNGGSLVTRLLRKLCGYSEVSRMISNSDDVTNCQGIRIFEPKTFYSIHQHSWRDLFNETESDEVMKRIEEGHAVHLYNSMMKSNSVTMFRAGSRQPMVRLRQKYCPRVYRNTPMSS